MNDDDERETPYTLGGPVSGYGPQFFTNVDVAYGPEYADAVWLASLPVDERLRVIEHRLAQAEARLREIEAEAE